MINSWEFMTKAKQQESINERINVQFTNTNVHTRAKRKSQNLWPVSWFVVAADARTRRPRNWMEFADVETLISINYPLILH